MGNRVIVTVCLVGLLGGDVRAEEGDAKTAHEAFAEGTRLFEQNKYIKAIEAFEKAYRLRPHYRVQCSIARCYQIMGDAIEAVEHFRRCLKEGAESTPIAPNVNRMLKDAQALIAWIKISSPGGGGTIYVDDVEKGRTPGRIALNPGTHVIRVEREGTRPATAKIRTLGGEERDLTLIPTPLESDTTDKTKDKDKDKDKDTPTVTDRPRRRLSPVWFWTAVGATAALAVGTIIAGVMTRQARDDYNDDPTEDGLDSFKSRKLTTNVLFGATAAAAAGGTALFFLTDFGGKESASGKETFLLGAGLRGTF